VRAAMRRDALQTGVLDAQFLVVFPRQSEHLSYAAVRSWIFS
jgi:hypothetical protein